MISEGILIGLGKIDLKIVFEVALLFIVGDMISTMLRLFFFVFKLPTLGEYN